jgi:hypothetical protein
VSLRYRLKPVPELVPEPDFSGKASKALISSTAPRGGRRVISGVKVMKLFFFAV